MRWETLENKGPEVETVGEGPAIEIEIRPNEAFMDTLRELFDESRQEIQEEGKEVIEEAQKSDQEEVDKIWSQIGPRIP